MKNKKQSLRKRMDSYLKNHRRARCFLDYAWASIVTIVSAILFVIGVNVFLAPTFGSPPPIAIVSGGSSGFAQAFVLVGQIIKGGQALDEKTARLIYGIGYVALNIPLVILAFKGIGFRFGLFTMINVAVVGILTPLFTGPFFDDLARFVNEHGAMLSRTIFAAICTGVSSALAYKVETSGGGFDVVAYYLSLHKSGNAGAYGGLINATALIAFMFLSPFAGNVTGADGGLVAPNTAEAWASAIGGVFFSALYLFLNAIIIDAINVRNKKVQLQIITSRNDLADILISGLPHGATVLNGKGAFSGEDRYVIYMVISSLELHYAIDIIREADPNSFVNVTAIRQVYGRFFMRPVR